MENLNNRVIKSKWAHLDGYFKQLSESEESNIMFKCLLCLPKEKIVSTSNTSNSNLRTHIKVSTYLYSYIRRVLTVFCG